MLKGHCPSNKNLWKRGKGGRTYIESETQALIDTLTEQAKIAWIGREQIVQPNVMVCFHVSSRCQDRDNMLTTILDCLREAGVIQNDNIAQFNGTITVPPAVFSDEEYTTI